MLCSTIDDDGRNHTVTYQVAMFVVVLLSHRTARVEVTERICN